MNEEITEITLMDKHVNVDGASSIESFYKGLYFLYRKDLAQARNAFINSINSSDLTDLNHWKSVSYLGLVEVLLFRSNGGLKHCYDAARENSKDAEIQLNVAYAEHILGNRKRSINAIEYSLQLNPGDIQSNNFLNFIGKRKRERNLLSKSTFAKMLRKKNASDLQESFINFLQDGRSVKLDMFVKTAVS